jgi:hypothetical protein
MAVKKKPAKPRNPIARMLRAVGLFKAKTVEDKRKKAPVKKAPKWRQDDSAE